MDAEQVAILVVVLMPFLLIAEGLLAILIWRLTGHAAPRLLPGHPVVGPRDRPVIHAEGLAIWVVASSVTMAVAFLLLFAAEYAVLFTLGRVAASIGLVGSVVFLGALPIVWALVLLRRAGRE